jgi:hypothetical protein
MNSLKNRHSPQCNRLPKAPVVPAALYKGVCHEPVFYSKGGLMEIYGGCMEVSYVMGLPSNHPKSDKRFWYMFVLKPMLAGMPYFKKTPYGDFM